MHCCTDSEACLESSSFTTLCGAVTWHAIYGHSDKGGQTFQTWGKVGKVFQHTAVLVRGGCEIQSHTIWAGIKTFQPLFFFSNFERLWEIFYQEFNNQWWIVTFLKTAHGLSRLPIFVWWVVVMIYHGYRRYLYIQQHVRLHLPSVKWDGKQQVLVSSDRLEFSSSVVYFRAVHLFFPVVYTISWKVWPVTATNKAIKILGGGAANISKGSDSLFHLGPHNPLHINPAHIFRFAGKHSGHY